jgi:hypothetical protein
MGTSAWRPVSPDPLKKNLPEGKESYIQNATPLVNIAAISGGSPWLA